jgi:hypothetical protein
VDRFRPKASHAGPSQNHFGLDRPTIASTACARGTRSPHIERPRRRDCRWHIGRCGAAAVTDQALGDPTEHAGQDLGGGASQRRAVHDEAVKKRLRGGVRSPMARLRWPVRSSEVS